MDHIELFELTSDYDNYIQSEDALLPNISLILETAKLYYNPVIIKNYLRLIAVEDSSILITSANANSGELDNTLDLLYSKNGTSWTQYDFTPIQLNAGETLYMKGNNPNGFSSINMETGVGRICTFGDMLGTGNSTTGTYECHGNVMSLLYGDDFEDKTAIPAVLCFAYLFSGCAGLLTAPELPATTLTMGCYGMMFSGCYSLVNAPSVLPATTLVDQCYMNMFTGCESLVNAPELPATTLVSGCYQEMFKECYSLVNAPSILPATTLTDNCYNQMFCSCYSLVNAPELPATTLAEACYNGMFLNCTSLVNAPELPATTLADYCYQHMFKYCESLVNAPSILPATTLKISCYSNMFESCTSLVNAPELPATMLAEACYQYMFYRCTSLVNAPELPATTLANRCYYDMFYNCININNIIMLATDISASDCLSGWVYRVASTGTFIKHNNMTSLPTGNNGIPEGWEVKDIINLTECTSLTITADDVRGNDTTTTIHYSAICNGIDYKGNTVTGFVNEGTAVSSEFPQNTSETETIERTIAFEFMGLTASTTITQGVWINQSYTVDLNNQWELSSNISNPDSSLYDGVYQSFSNKGKSGSAALMYIDITGYTSFKFYVRSNAESGYDYVVVSNLDSTLTNSTTGGSAVKMTTSGKQNSGTSISNYTLVEFTGIDGNAHRITVMYRKDSSGDSGDDRGYVLIPKNQ